MCWKCAHPNATRRDYLEHILDVIAVYGWAVEGVRRDGLRPPWAYTIGLTAAGLPELVVVGMPVPRATGLLNDAARHVIHADTPMRAGDRVQLTGGPSIDVVEPTATTARLVTAIDIYGGVIRALQLVRVASRLSALRPSRTRALISINHLVPAGGDGVRSVGAHGRGGCECSIRIRVRRSWLRA